MDSTSQTSVDERDPNEIRQSLRRFIAMLARLCAAELTRMHVPDGSTEKTNRVTFRKPKRAK